MLCSYRLKQLANVSKWKIKLVQVGLWNELSSHWVNFTHCTCARDIKTWNLERERQRQTGWNFTVYHHSCKICDLLPREKGNQWRTNTIINTTQMYLYLFSLLYCERIKESTEKVKGLHSLYYHSHTDVLCYHVEVMNNLIRNKKGMFSTSSGWTSYVIRLISRCEREKIREKRERELCIKLLPSKHTHWNGTVWSMGGKNRLAQVVLYWVTFTSTGVILY